MTQLLTERYRERLYGVLSCFDRIVITGTLPGICYAAGMTSFLYAKGIRIFDYAGSSSSAARTSARRTWWPRCWLPAASIPDWCT